MCPLLRCREQPQVTVDIADGRLSLVGSPRPPLVLPASQQRRLSRSSDSSGGAAAAPADNTNPTPWAGLSEEAAGAAGAPSVKGDEVALDLVGAAAPAPLPPPAAAHGASSGGGRGFCRTDAVRAAAAAAQER